MFGPQKCFRTAGFRRKSVWRDVSLITSKHLYSKMIRFILRKKLICSHKKRIFKSAFSTNSFDKDVKRKLQENSGSILQRTSLAEGWKFKEEITNVCFTVFKRKLDKARLPCLLLVFFLPDSISLG